jgi:hypothetical protein
MGSSPVRWHLIIGFGLAAVLLVGLLLPAINQSREVICRRNCVNQLHQIGLALQQYHVAYGCLPPAHVADAEGRPLYSWRVLILPFLDQQAIAADFDHDEPWNSTDKAPLSPTDNFTLSSNRISTFTCPDRPIPESASYGNPVVNYLALTGPGTAFPGATSTRFSDFKDGLSQTILVVDTDQAQTSWASPVDLDPRTGLLTNAPGPNGRPGPYTSHPKGQIPALCGDGAVRLFTPDQLRKLLPAAATIAGGEAIAWPK